MNLMTVREVAETLKVSPMTVRRYIASGKLQAVRVGRGVRVDEAAITRFLEPVGIEDTDAPEGAEAGVLSAADTLWNIIGIMEDGPQDLARNHDKYLAEAYADRHDQ